MDPRAYEQEFRRLYPVPLQRMQVGKFYEVSDGPFATFIRAEVVQQWGEWGTAFRLRETRRAEDGTIVPEGTRFTFDPDDGWRGREVGGRLAARYSKRDLFATPIDIREAKIGEEYGFLLPGVSKTSRDPNRVMFATLKAVDPGPPIMQRPTWNIRVELSPEFQETWGLVSPILEWDAKPEDIAVFDPPAARKASRFLPRMDLPIELKAKLMTYLEPRFKGGPYPGKEQQKAYWREEYERQSDEALAAMKGGRKTRRRRRSLRKKTRRRN